MAGIGALHTAHRLESSSDDGDDNAALLDASCPAAKWEPIGRAMLCWLPMRERRRLTAFVCSEQHPRACVRRFVFSICLKNLPTPEAGLRALLLHFPFLPIDAGSGADRVIGEFALSWLEQNSESLCNLGLTTSTAIRKSRDAVYSLTYSIIMLNTDLHNPVVWPKITPDEYVRSCHGCEPLSQVPASQLIAIYENIRTTPLQITTQSAAVSSIMRSTAEAEIEVPAQYSVYSSLRPTSTPTAEAHGNSARRDHPAIDWNVAYWNLVDMFSDARHAVTHGLLRRSTLVRAMIVLVLAMLLAAIAHSAAANLQKILHL